MINEMLLNGTLPDNPFDGAEPYSAPEDPDPIPPNADALDDLARRAVACAGWRWMPGMLMDCSRPYIFRVVRVDDDGCPMESVGGGIYGPGRGSANGAMRAWDWSQWKEHGMLPDLNDPATLGCLLALVREAWDGPLVTMLSRWAPPSVVEWRVVFDGTLDGPGRSWSPTWADALVLALEAAGHGEPL